jgi:hypothetical protein
MTKCKYCKEEINLRVFGSPDDVCYGCLSKPEIDKVLNDNIKLKDKK